MQLAQEFNSLRIREAELPHIGAANPPTAAQTTPRAWVMPADCDKGEERVSDALVERAKEGDRAALDALLAGVRNRAMATALKILHNPDDAEDAVQEAFLKAWRCLPGFEGRSTFATWIHRIVSNASLDLLRRNAGKSEGTGSGEVPEAVVEQATLRTPESDLGSLEIQLLVRSAIAALPQAHRQAVELRELEDYSYLEIAEATHCPLGTVMSRLHHARQKLAADLRAPLGEARELYAA
jgi:RNA polymerase sigma-70 factor (ECF subfamily)